MQPASPLLAAPRTQPHHRKDATTPTRPNQEGTSARTTHADEMNTRSPSCWTADAVLGGGATTQRPSREIPRTVDWAFPPAGGVIGPSSTDTTREITAWGPSWIAKLTRYPAMEGSSRPGAHTARQSSSPLKRTVTSGCALTTGS